MTGLAGGTVIAFALWPGMVRAEKPSDAKAQPKLAAAENRSEESAFATEIRPLLETYCFSCHGPEKQKGDVRLDTFGSETEVIHDRKLWLRVLEQIEIDEMPPKKPFLAVAEREKLLAWLDTSVNHIDWSKFASAGHVTIPRLNKLEYDNTMRDLLGIDIHPGELFTDDGEGESGFNNDRDALFVTPSLLEKYLETAEHSLNALTAHAETKERVNYFLEAEDMFMTETKTNLSDLGGGKGYYLNRGQMTLYDSIEVPADGFYEFVIRARSNRGATGARLRVNDVVKGDVVVPRQELEEFKLVVFLEAGSRQMAWNIQRPVFGSFGGVTLKDPADYPPLPENASEIIGRDSLRFGPQYPVKGDGDKDLSAAIRDVNRHLMNVQRAIEWLNLHGPEGDPREIERFRRYVKERTVDLDIEKDELAALLKVTRKEIDDRIAKNSVEAFKRNESIFKAVEQIRIGPASMEPGDVGIDWVRVRGPVKPATLEGAEPVLFVKPGKDLPEDTAAEKILTRFAYRAFRRPLREGELDRYLALYQDSRAAGEPYLPSLKMALSAILVSPNFLYRHEQRPEAEGEYALNDYQLASRLSYFLWMTMPDKELFALAEQGKLSDEKVLDQQVERLLKDPRADRFARYFVGQWLGFGPEGESIFPDERKYGKEFTPALKQAVVEEPVKFFRYLVDENRSLLELVDSGETFLNEDLAKLYGIRGVKGSQMQKVSLKTRNRGGVMGMASVLTATSTPVRTSPVIRGAWIYEKMLGQETPVPPPNAGELSDNAGETKGKTLLEELKIHREREECAGCHAKIDPLGFSLENFDPIGRWRDSTPAGPVESQGELESGTTLSGIEGLKDYLLEHRRDDFVRGVAENLLAFALGRELRGFDEPAVQEIVDRLNENELRARVLVKEVVKSHPFQHQNPEPVLPGA